MADVKVHVDYNVGRKILNSEGVTADLQRRTTAILSAVGSFGSGSFEASVKPGRTRPSGRVACKDAQAVKTNAKTNALLKALNAGGG